MSCNSHLLQGSISSCLFPVNEIQVYKEILINPNPVSSLLDVNLISEGSYFEVEVYDIWSKKIMNLDVTSLDKGTYFLVVNNGTKTVSSKFVKK